MSKKYVVKKNLPFWAEGDVIELDGDIEFGLRTQNPTDAYKQWFCDITYLVKNGWIEAIKEPVTLEEKLMGYPISSAEQLAEICKAHYKEAVERAIADWRDTGSYAGSLSNYELIDGIRKAIEEA